MKRLKIYSSYLNLVLSENKNFEIQWHKPYSYSYCGFKFDLSFTRKCDHAGGGLYLHFLFWGIDFNVYDKRHWDRRNDCWETPSRNDDDFRHKL